MVAQAAAKQGTSSLSQTSLRLVEHLVDVSSKATNSALTSEAVETIQQNIVASILQAQASCRQQGSSRDTTTRTTTTSATTGSTSTSTTSSENSGTAWSSSATHLEGYDWATEHLERLQTDSTTNTSFSSSDNSSYYNNNAANQQSLSDSDSDIHQGPQHASLATDSPRVNSQPKQPSQHTRNATISKEMNPLVFTENVIRPAHSTNNTPAAPEPPLPQLQEGQAVPSSRIGRALGFASLGVGLLYGTAMEGIGRAMGSSSKSSDNSSSSSSIIVNDANADRLAATLCRMRGAALKMGQMLSIQDEALLPPPLVQALHKVRQGADAMPNYQLIQQMEAQLGTQWRDYFQTFEELPFAAASIGQVHRAKLINKDTAKLQDVVVKVQYPGVARSIQSDLRNLGMLVQWTGLAPKGLFIENVIQVGTVELQVECDYRREMLNQQRIKQLVENDTVLRANQFVVPGVIKCLTSEQVLTSEYRPGGTIDKVAYLSQDERNRVGRNILYLTMKELFEWRFMQTDPNWGNFLYDPLTQTTSLIDFGAAREYSKSFVDGYLRIVWASANQDEETLMKQSYAMNFLTGDENAQMLRAHKLSGYTVGEPFYKDEPFDFRGSNISTRMGEHTSVFLSHRLTPPPEEVYTLHRKLAGAYMLCIKLGAVVRCRDMLQEIVRNHNFEDGPAPEVW